MACSRNVDHRVPSDDVANFASRFFTHFLPVDVTICGSFDFMRMSLLCQAIINRLLLRKATGVVENFGFRVTFSSTLD